MEPKKSLSPSAFMIPRPYLCQFSNMSTKSERTRSVFRSLCFPIVCASDLPIATDKIELNDSSRRGLSSLYMEDLAIKAYISRESGMDRLKNMYSKDYKGFWSPELTFISMICTQTGAATFLIMSVFAGRHARERFVDRHKATVFPTKFKAHRSLQDEIFMASLKDGAKWAFRVSVFSCSLLFISQSIAVYRNKTSLWEYIAGFGIAGSLGKISLGPKGMFAGGVFGGLLGACGGLVVWGSMHVMNQTQEERHYLQIKEYLEDERDTKGKSLLRTEKQEQSENDDVA